MNTKEIAQEIVARYGKHPALDLIDKARSDGFLISLGVTNILEVFHIAQELNKGEK
jgi:hypothetical protein